MSLDIDNDAPVVELNDTTPTSDTQQPVATDTTTETQGADETPEQTNERVLAERKARSEARQNGVERRIRELTQQRHEAERRAEQAMQLAQRAYEQRNAAPAAQSDSNAEPVRGNDEDYADWIARRAEWRAERRADARIEARLREVTQQQGNQQLMRDAQVVRQDFETHMEKFAKSVPDWQETVAENHEVNLPEEAIGHLHTMGADGPRLMYAFGKNPALAEQLHGKSFPKQVEILGRLAAAVRASKPQVSAAPAPGQPAGTRVGASTKDPAKMNYDEFVAFRRKQIAARR